jgi:transposase
MKELSMYSVIKDLQRKGFTERQTSTILKVNRKTVSKYRRMSLDDYMDYSIRTRKLGCLEKHKSVILEWLQCFPNITAAQVHDWILEHYGSEVEVSERTVSRYVKALRLEYGIQKNATPREYEATEELPMGHQMQLDFGVKNMPLADRKGHRKVYFVGIVLAHSRYKWGYFQTKPFNSGDLVRAMSRCFDYFGGVTNEIVVDQDSIIVVSENRGDILYTHEFEQYKNLLNLNIWVCRKADPESKGMVESTVKYIKGNFLPHRNFMEEDDLNEAFLAWLDRTGNAKVHGTTKKVPAQVFEFEREHLRAVQSKIYNLTPSIIRTVRKDNTILYNSNRYSLPLGTYTKHSQVSVVTTEDSLIIYDSFGDYEITTHPISALRGSLIKQSEHRRDKNSSFDQMEAEVLDALSSSWSNEWRLFLKSIRESMPRYYRDHLTLLKHLIQNFSNENLEDAMIYCSTRDLYSINDLKSAVEYMSQYELDQGEEFEGNYDIQLLNNQSIVSLDIQKRRISDYELLEGEVHE